MFEIIKTSNVLYKISRILEIPGASPPESPPKFCHGHTGGYKAVQDPCLKPLKPPH